VSQFFTTSVLVATVASGIRLATPYLFAALGETLGQRSGVLNLGVDGVMLLGAFFAYWTALETDNLGLAVLVSAIAGLAMGVVYAIVTLAFKAEQGISGIGVYLFGLGFSELLYREKVGTPLPTRSLSDWRIPLLGRIPEVGDMLFDHTPLVYAAFALVPLLSLLIGRTRFGLNVRAVGETPEAADSMGVSVVLTRSVTILVGNMMAGVAGGALALELGIFQQNLTAGIGFIAVALVYFGSWRPTGVMVGAVLYGLLNATVNQWKTLGIVTGSTASLTTAAPAVLTIAALVVIARRRTEQPAALTLPFVRGAS
jgi:general nucleoside transport system permease protein